MEEQEKFGSKNGKSEPVKDFFMLGLAYVLVCFWVCLGTRQPLFGLVLSALFYPFALILYAQLHRYYHAYSKNKMRYHLVGIAYSAITGLSWVLYMAHHANHHKFNNGPGDWSKTTNKQGLPIVGWRYMLREALRPFLLQLIPFLSLFGMKPGKRNAMACLDEAMRVLIRVVTFHVLGLGGLFFLLLWQFIFVFAILYLNYLQHFGLDEGQGAVWSSPCFNSFTDQLGYHDQHHRYPSYAEQYLPKLATQVIQQKATGLFSPRVFFLFLFRPDALSRYLNNELGQNTTI